MSDQTPPAARRTSGHVRRSLERRAQFYLECMSQQRQMTEPFDPSQIRFDVQQRIGHPPLPLVGILPGSGG